MKKMKTIILSLGGSMIVPEKIDIEFLKSFKKLILEFSKQGNKIAIICGGGRICRIYQEAAKEVTCSKIDSFDLDMIGIKSTKLNAELVRSVFGKEAYEKVLDDPEDKIKTDKKIIIGAGYLPGHSTDTDAVLLAKNIGADTIINLTNIDYVFDKDPRTHKDARPMEKLSWKDYLAIIGEEWIPGRSTPFDPVAAKEAMKLKKKVIIINGSDLANLKKCMEGNKFKGTVIG